MTFSEEIYTFIHLGIVMYYSCWKFHID